MGIGQCDHAEVLLALNLPVAPSAQCCVVPRAASELPGGQMEASLSSGLSFANTTQQAPAAAKTRRERIDPEATLRGAMKVVH